MQFAQPQGGWSLEALLAGRKHINGDGLVMRTLTHSTHHTHTLSYNITKEKLTILQRGGSWKKKIEERK